jgi:hypothetical protein
LATGPALRESRPNTCWRVSGIILTLTLFPRLFRPGPVTNSSGSGVGATRTYTLGGNVTYDETLQTQETNATTDALHQQWNFTEAGPVELSSNLTVYNAFNDLTVYTNSTTNQTSVQYFILACFSNQAEGLTAIAQTIQSTISFFASEVNGTATAAPARRFVKLF